MSFLGKKHTEETKKKMSLRAKGNKSNLGRKFSATHRKRISTALKMHKRTKEHADHISMSKLGKRNEQISGKKHWNWKGGISGERQKIQNSLEYKQLIKDIKERDDYTCQECGIRNKKGLGKTVVLHVDHIQPFKNYPELRFETSNLRTLCWECHKKTPTYGGKMHKINI